MNTKERLTKFINENKQVLTGLLIAFVFALLGLSGGVALEETNPEAVTLRGVRFTPTVAQGRQTSTATKPAPTLPANTATMLPSETPIPGATGTKVPTVTPGTFPTITPTLQAGACPEIPNEWHMPKDEFCQRWHSGIDPRSPEVLAIFNAGYKKADGTAYNLETDFLNPYGELWQPLWLSSATEEKWGMKYVLFEYGDTCSQTTAASETTEYGCVVAVLIRLHSDGTFFHLVKRSHSSATISKICYKLPNGKADLTRCGVLQISGSVDDYGFLELYKQKICHLNSEPGYPYPDELIDQQSYRTFTTALDMNGNILNFWVAAPPNAIVKDLYPAGANAFKSFSWADLDNYQLFPTLPGNTRNEPDIAKYCNLPGGFETTQHFLNEVPPVDGMEHKTFQLIQLSFESIPPVPGTYWYDVKGVAWPLGDCEEASGQCVPYIIAGVMPPKAMVAYGAGDRGDCAIIPCFIAETFGVPMPFPPDDGRGH